MTKETLNKIHNMLCSMEAALITDPVHNKGQVIDCIALIKGAIEAECRTPQVTLQPTALDLIAAEREKQFGKGYTVEHDIALYDEGDLLWLAHRLTLEDDPSCPEDWNEQYWKRLLAIPYKDRVRIAATWYAKELEILLHLEQKEDKCN